MLFRKLILKGFLLGALAGLLVSVADSLFMLKSNIYVPASYPCILITFNTVFWAMIGGLSGSFLWLYIRKNEKKEDNDFYWALSFLVPFSIIYGILGKIEVPHLTVKHQFLTHTYDHHFSFIWVALVLLFFFYNLRQHRDKGNFSSSLFLLEIVTIIILFQTGSNLEFFANTFVPNKYFSDTFKAKHLLTLYLAGTVTVIGLYFLAARLFFKRKFFINPYIKGTFLFFILFALLSSLTAFGQNKSFEKKLAALSTRQALSPDKPPAVILIVLDTVRADRLSVYQRNSTSPNLKIFSQDALIFEQCLTPSPWTLPSHASLFTGYYPSEHMCNSASAKLHNKFTTLAETFHSSGYNTAAVVSNIGWLHRGFNIDQGFQLFDNRHNIGRQWDLLSFKPLLLIFSYLTNLYPRSIVNYRYAEDINRAAVRVLDKVKGSPAFLFVNYMDAHAPYRPPQPFDNRFLDKQFPQLYRLKQYFLRYLEKHDKSAWDSYLLSQYEGQIAYLDDQLGKFFSILKKRGLYDESLIIVTSDHGEYLGEHGLYLHGPCKMYEEVLKVPLIVKFPFSKNIGQKKGRISLTDIFAMILTTSNLPIPEGVPVKAYSDNSTSAFAELYDFRNKLTEHRVIYDENFKYLNYKNREPELYDLEQDPFEMENLAGRYPDIAAACSEKIKKWKDVHKPKHEDSAKKIEPLSKDKINALKALGYIN